MNKFNFKQIIPVIALIILCIPIATSSLLDLKQREINKLILEQERIQKEAQEKLYLMGKFDPAQREDFILVPTEYNVSGYKMYLRKETLDGFLKMQDKAEKDEVKLKIASATRNFIYQKNIWNNKWSGITLVNRKNLSKNIPNGLERFKKILEYSAVPGTSRHHWGTEIDINNANPEYFETETGKKVYEWLIKNAPLFGFCQPYNLKKKSTDNSLPASRHGYNEEKWHWSYLPLAKNFTQEYKKLITNTDIKDFNGAKYVPNLNLINQYVLGINPDCL